MEAPLGPSRESINARATTYEPNHASGKGLGPPTLYVRFTPESGHQLAAIDCPLCANSGHSGEIEDRSGVEH